MFKLAMIQMRVEPGEREANLARAGSLVAEAVLAGAGVVVLPEAMTLGWTHPPGPGDRGDSIPDGPSARELIRLARLHRIHLCAGLVEAASGETFNSAVLIDPEGAVVLHHRKLNELDIARSVYSGGDRLGVVRTSLGVFGLMICADAFVPGQVISRALGEMGAQVILSPCSWAVEADHDNQADPYGRLWVDSYEPVAREFGIWIIGVSNVGWIRGGAWGGRKCIGSSLAMSPQGVRYWGPYGVDAEAIVYLDVGIGDEA